MVRRNQKALRRVIASAEEERGGRGNAALTSPSYICSLVESKGEFYSTPPDIREREKNGESASLADGEEQKSTPSSISY